MATGSPDEVLSNPPCFRSGMLWGIGTGLLVGAQRYRMTKRARTSCDWAVLSFGTVAAGSWFFCRNAYLSRARYTREFMEVMNDPTRRVEAEQFLRSRIEPNNAGAGDATATTAPTTTEAEPTPSKQA